MDATAVSEHLMILHILLDIVSRSSSNLPYEKLLAASHKATSKNPQDFRESALEAGKLYEGFADGTVRDITDEVPFEIPESWEWVRLNTIAVSELGKTLDKAKNTGEYHPYLCSINVYWDGVDLTKVKQAKFEESELPKYRLYPGDLLICEGGDVGRSAVWNSEAEMYYQNALHRVRFFGEINPYYFHMVMECYKGNKILDEHSKGMTIKHLVQSSLNSIYFPLPPLAEQSRIVDALSSIQSQLEHYNTVESELSNLNNSFPGILRKSILQQAVMGKLVPQDENDEPASILLERIRAEKQALIKAGKLKKDKHESIIYRRDNSHYEKLDGVERCIDDEIPFDIPENWVWCRLGSIG
ncbi:MAG: restriction endonuclease subunit S, partial [Lachnospiraceae bacterium]|nr:restriction endonuclease subunit S [Lachnospiraceae bacterium]